MHDKTINACKKIIAKIEEHQAEMKLVREEGRQSGDLWVMGFNVGVLNGLEAAINIIKKIEDEHYRKLTDALLKKAKK